MPMLESGPFSKGYSLRLILIRHGEPEPEAKGRCYGSLDVGLSDSGRAQIETKLILLRSFIAEALYTSPLTRAAESAAIVGLGLRLKPTLAPELREIDFGRFEGLRYEEIERLYPEEYKLWMEHPTEIKFPQGESFTEMKARVLRFKEFLQKSHDQQAVVLVCHGGTNRILLAEALGIPDERTFCMDQGYAAINIIDYFEGRALVRLVNG
jgi:alpha-ribazole phosphatase